jgi:hypothetical protein
LEQKSGVVALAKAAPGLTALDAGFAHGYSSIDVGGGVLMQIMQVSYSASRMCSSRAITFTFTRAHTHTHTHTHTRIQLSKHYTCIPHACMCAHALTLTHSIMFTRSLAPHRQCRASLRSASRAYRCPISSMCCSSVAHASRSFMCTCTSARSVVAFVRMHHLPFTRKHAHPHSL